MAAESASTTTVSQLERVAAPLLVEVISYLWPRDVVRLGASCQSLRTIAIYPIVWKSIFHRVWPIDCDHSHPWHQVFLTRMRLCREGRNQLCTVCECVKGFRSKEALQNHESDGCRPHTGHKRPRSNIQRTKACRHCKKMFAHSHERQRHERIHTGEKPYPCSVCPQRFTQSCNRAKHMKTHHK